MKGNWSRVLAAVLIYGVATAVSVRFFGGEGPGLIIDGALLLGLFYYLSTLRRDN